MLRRLPFGVTVALVLAASAHAGGGLEQRKQSVDARLDHLHAAIASARARESSLTLRISAVTGQIRALEGRVGDVSQQLVILERDLTLHRRRLGRLTRLLRVQTRRYGDLRRDYGLALLRYDRRLVAIYQGQDVSTLDVLLAASSFTDLLERLDYARAVGLQDAEITEEVGVAKSQMRAARAATRRTRSEVASATRVIAVRTSQVRGMRDRLLAERASAAARRGRTVTAYAAAKASERAAAGEADELESESAELTAQIQAAQAAAATRAAAAARAAASPPPAPAASASRASPRPAPPAPQAVPTSSSSGFVWPVSGPVTSPFGMRWGRMHTGIDIGVPYGTPIHAAASGIVIYAGWEGGYGNLVVIQHEAPLATAYGHQSGIAVASGAHVSQGQVIGYVGCTGHCFGPHLHFEVRVNGEPVDPLAYL